MKVSALWLLLLLVATGVAPALFFESVGAEKKPAAATAVSPQSQETKTSPAHKDSDSKDASSASFREVFAPTGVRLESAPELALRFAIGGHLRSLKVKPGDRVKRGQVVAELQDAQVRAELAELKLKAQSTVIVEFAQHAVRAASDRAVAMTERNRDTKAAIGTSLYTDDEMAEFQMDVVKAEAELRKAREDHKLAELRVVTQEAILKRYVLHSPIDGVVVSVLQTAGLNISSEDVVLIVVDPSVLSLVCNVPPNEIRRVRKGLRVEFHPLVELQADAVIGEVLRFGSRAIRDEANSIEVICELRDVPEHVREGTFGTAVFMERVENDE